MSGSLILLAVLPSLVRRVVRNYGDPPLAPGESERTRRKPPERPADDPTPSPEVVEKFHRNAAVDNAPTDIHHTIGPGTNQAAAGDHDHKKGSANSKPLLDGIVITGSRGGNAALFSIINALVQFGARDNTSA